MLKRVLPKLTALAILTFLSACGGGTFETAYDEGLSVDKTTNWRVTDVHVVVPRTLSVSEAPVLVPKADIVWREDSLGNRYEQVSQIVTSGIRTGSSTLNGDRPVRLNATVSRFHAMTLEAEALNYDVGVHSIDFTLEVVDSQTDDVLVPATFIRAEFPAMTGVRMTQARLRGETQRSQIEGHIAYVIEGWLGVGPDPRARFRRLGG